MIELPLRCLTIYGENLQKPWRVDWMENSLMVKDRVRPKHQEGSRFKLFMIGQCCVVWCIYLTINSMNKTLVLFFYARIYLLFATLIVYLVFLHLAQCICASLMLFVELYGYPDEENMIMEQEENVENMRRSKVSAENTTRATGKTKMTKEERSRLMEEKKLQKEVGFSL